MATPVWPTRASLEPLFHQHIYRFEFHQAIKVLELSYPNRSKLGETTQISQEVVNIKSRTALSYPSSDIYKLEQTRYQDTPLPTLTVNFMGLAGSSGPLPLPYSEKIIKRIQNRDLATQSFLDIFNHRIISILHLIRKKTNFTLETHHPQKSSLAKALFSLAGIRLESHRKRFSFPDHHLLRYTRFFWQKKRSSETLSALLQTYFKVPVKIEPFQGRWFPIPDEEKTHIGDTGKNQILGHSAALGVKIWDQIHTIMIHIGPLKKDIFVNFLESGNLYQPLLELTRFYLPLNHGFLICLELESGNALPTILGKSLLERSSWLGHHIKDNERKIILRPSF